jgi:hypothetical protein
LTRNTVLTFVANFEKATLAVSAESISWLPTRDRVPVEIDCEVEYGPVFGTAEPETSEADAIWTRIREIANHVSPDAAPAPPDALLARAPEGVRAASEAARDMAAGGTRASLRDLPYFADNVAGRDYACTPNGRAIAVGYPAERCAAMGAAKAALSFSAISDAYGACVAALPATRDAGRAGMRLRGGGGRAGVAGGPRHLRLRGAAESAVGDRRRRRLQAGGEGGRAFGRPG